ncbi:MAG: hypothetical protein ABS935_08980 [Solibacillus sp.]|uniref:hypothetical protein n=1 Tax=Solibacillus sp. TaxID=1909654 RepID=UPI003315BAEC
MSRRFMAMLAVTLLVFISSTVVLHSKTIEEPLIIPFGTQVLQEGNEEEQFITVSYLTNRNENVEIPYISAGNLQLSTIKNDGQFNPLNTKVDTKMETYQYYELHSVQFKVEENMFELLKDLNEVTAVFSNGNKQTFPLNVAILEKYNGKPFTVKQQHELVEEGALTTFTVKEVATIKSIESTFPLENIGIYKDEKLLTLPYNTEKGENLSIRTSSNFSFWPSMYTDIILHGTLDTGEPFLENLRFYMDNPPSEQYVENFVQEMGDR